MEWSVEGVMGGWMGGWVDGEQSLQFNVLGTTYEVIMRDRARHSKVCGGAGCWVQRMQRLRCWALRCVCGILWLRSCCWLWGGAVRLRKSASLRWQPSMHS